MAEIKYLEINADDRSIIIPEGENLLGVENDNKGVRKYFICPKIVGDNIDLTKSDVYINVQNASGEKSGKDRYPVQNMTASGDNVTFEWVLERKVTSHKGSVRFAVCVREKGSEREWHTTFATATAPDILTGKTAYGKDGKLTGSMLNNGAVDKSISNKSESYTIPQGYHNGSGKVAISESEQAKIIASNIKKGVSILGVTGSYEATASGGNNNCEAYLVDVTNPTVSFKTTSGTIKAYGYAYETTKSQWGGSSTTVYTFNGTNYYKSAFYGSPAATNITLGVSGGKLTGLPTGLSGGTLLVVRGI